MRSPGPTPYCALSSSIVPKEGAPRPGSPSASESAASKSCPGSMCSRNQDRFDKSAALTSWTRCSTWTPAAIPNAPVRSRWPGRKLRSRGSEADTAEAGYSLFAISKRDLRRLRELHLEYVRAMQNVIAESTPGECVGLYNAQLMDLATLHNALE